MVPVKPIMTEVRILVACFTNKNISKAMTIRIKTQQMNCNILDIINSFDKIFEEVDSLMIGISTVGKQMLINKN